MNPNLGIGSRIMHEKFGAGVVINVRSHSLNVSFIKHGLKEIKAEEISEVIDEIAPDMDMVSMYDVERTLKNILQKWSGISPDVKLGDKWVGGKLVLMPGRPGIQGKEVPIEQFFQKIILARDRLRVMEQRINKSNLDAEEKISLQQYVTKIQGSFTTFNLLFKYPDDYFTGDKSQKEPGDVKFVK